MRLTDRQRVDLALLPNMLFKAAKQAEADQTVIDALYHSCWEPLTGLDTNKKLQIIRRIERVHHKAMGRVDGDNLAKVLVMLFRLAEMVAEEGIVQFYAHGLFTLALEKLAEALARDHADAWNERVEASATKAARKVLADLQKEGYLCPPTI